MIEGVKEITLENWNQPDLVYDIEEYNIYLKEILNLKLDSYVPVNIRELFEAARGAMVYGYYYYPLYTLADDQMYRVGERAVKEKIKLVQVDEPVKMSFYNSIKYLHANGFLDERSFSKWNSLRSLRNFSSHPERFVLMPPAAIIEYAKGLASEINKLFNNLD